MTTPTLPICSAAMTTLLKQRGRLSPTDAKTVKSFPFDVPAGVEAMSLVVEWSPHFSEDVLRNTEFLEKALAEWGGDELWDHPDVAKCRARLPNLLNTVLVEPSGRWRGRSDRGKATKDNPLVVDSRDPGPGFMPGPIVPGRWSLDLEVHSVVVDECEFLLEIKAVPPSSTTKARPAPRQHEKRGPGFFKGELHTHTRHSDGSHTVDELLRRARELGLDFLALTDHNTTSGGDEFFAGGLPGILGAELTTFRGHHVVLGLDEMVPWHAGGEVLDVNDVVRAVKGKGALFTLTHPFNLGDPICTGCRWTTKELDPKNVDLVEIWHRRWTGDVADNVAAHRLWNEMWKRGHRPTGVGVRDWHNKNHESTLPGHLPSTVVKAGSTSQRDLLDGLKRGAAYVTRGPHVAPSLVVDGKRAGLGEEIGTGGRASRLDVEIDLGPGAHAEKPRLEVWKNGEKIATLPAPSSGTYEVHDAKSGPAFWRVELHGEASPLAITNHIVAT